MRRDEDDDAASDEALLAGIAEGDEWATVVFVRRYQRRIFGLALSTLGDPGLAEDIAQEVFIRVLRHAPIYDARRAAVSTWVFAIARNLVRDALRMRRATPIDPDDFLASGLVSTERSPADSAEIGDDVGRLRVALAQLPFEQRRVVVMAAMFGQTCAEIAVSESIPLGTAKGRLRLGMAKLRTLTEVSES